LNGQTQPGTPWLAAILSARAAPIATGLQNAAFTTDANTLIDGFSAAKQAMDEKDVPVNSMQVHGLLRPAQWYLVASSDKNLNCNTNGDMTCAPEM